MNYESFDNIVFSANDDDRWRLQRVRKTLIYALGILDGAPTLQEFIAVHLAEIHDHKWHLTLTWKRLPCRYVKLAFRQAWLGPLGDGCDLVDHELVQVQ